MGLTFHCFVNINFDINLGLMILVVLCVTRDKIMLMNEALILDLLLHVQHEVNDWICLYVR